MQISVTTGDFHTMKKNVAVIFILIMLSCPPAARCLGTDMYVVDIPALNVRADSNEKANVVGIVKAGQKVLALSSAGGWTLIETADGLEGWVSIRYLSTDPPSEIKDEPAAAQPTTLREKFQAVTIENQSLKEENIGLTTRLNEQTIQMGAMEDSFQALKKDADAYHQLKDTLVQKETELKEKNNRIAAIEKKLIDQYTAVAIKWSLVGAGILLVGYMMGARTKKKRSSLL
ncbi:MAG: TIGR04211 family SH3 domain-containing protein [Desulfobacteraceae bacterium]|nr:MAG: TIGR04211 family SH3 domain-containing protein [Desulfobacteraceae bacterium]